jgi:hypothetical protein
MKIFLIASILVLGVACKSSEDNIVYKEVNGNVTLAKNAQVTNSFGTLSIQEGEFTGTTKIIPWSSWWFPTKDKYLFENSNPGELAPLQKYDLFVKNSTGTDPESALYERSKIYDPNVVNWAGLCHAWAMASVLTVEPKNAIIKDDITLSVGDQKSLLLKSFENASGILTFGTRNNGSYKDDYNDIYPDQFHKLAQVYLFEKHLPFLMDYDPSFPVWTVPIYNIKFKIEKINSTTAHVMAWVTIASPFVESPNYVGTKKSVKFYEYNLFGYWNGDSLIVSGSEWINDSIYDHPDFLIAYPDNVQRVSFNKKLDPLKIDALIGTKNVSTK